MVAVPVRHRDRFTQRVEDARDHEGDCQDEERSAERGLGGVATGRRGGQEADDAPELDRDER